MLFSKKPKLITLNPEVLGEQAEDLRAKLKSRIVGQDSAIERIIATATLCWSGLNSPNRPRLSLMFVGPTGVGKTELARALAEAMLGSADRLTRIDCAEYSYGHEISRLVGSPLGYVGHGTAGLLSTESLNKNVPDMTEYKKKKEVPVAIIIFDEVEKAADELRNLILGLLDCGTVGMGDTTVTDLRKSIIILSSNTGTQKASELAERGTLGFSVDKEPVNTDKVVLDAVKKDYAVEFLNRLDAVVLFHPLSMESAKTILDIELGKIQARVMDNPTPFLISITPEAKSHLLELGFSEKFGGREIRRTAENQIAVPLARLLASHQIIYGDLVYIGWNGEKFTFIKEPDGALVEIRKSELKRAPTLDSDHGLTKPRLKKKLPDCLSDQDVVDLSELCKRNDLPYDPNTDVDTDYTHPDDGPHVETHTNQPESD